MDLKRPNRVALLAGTICLGVCLGLYLLMFAAEWGRDQADKRDPGLKCVAQALLRHNEAHGRLPPAVVYDPAGRPLHSWRVLVLPSSDW